MMIRTRARHRIIRNQDRVTLRAAGWYFRSMIGRNRSLLFQSGAVVGMRLWNDVELD